MENQALFVDFMYAAVVAAALPRLQNEEVLEFNPLQVGDCFSWLVCF